jgi:hypothetical protein
MKKAQFVIFFSQTALLYIFKLSFNFIFFFNFSLLPRKANIS